MPLPLHDASRSRAYMGAEDPYTLTIWELWLSEKKLRAFHRTAVFSLTVECSRA